MSVTLLNISSELWLINTIDCPEIILFSILAIRSIGLAINYIEVAKFSVYKIASNPQSFRCPPGFMYLEIIDGGSKEHLVCTGRIQVQRYLTGIFSKKMMRRTTCNQKQGDCTKKAEHQHLQ